MPPAERVPEAAACGACGCTASGPFYRVHHPSKGARVLCEGHARRVVRPVADGGTKSSECEESGSTDSHTDRSPVESETGMVPRLRAANTMTASKTTPREGESADGASRTEEQQVLLEMAAGYSDVLVDYAHMSTGDDAEEIVSDLRELSRLSEGLAAALERTFNTERRDGGATSE